MAKKRNTGDPTEYTPAEIAELTEALDEAWAEYDETFPESGSEPGVARVQAQVEWAGVLDRARDGHRKVNFGIDGRLSPDAMREVKKALDRARVAQPSVRYDRKGWHAQLKQLTGTQRGYDAANRAGLSPTARTLREWLGEDRTPNAANQRKIHQAYEHLRNYHVDSARRAVADRFSEALTERYGAEIRLRGITDMNLEP